MQPWKVAWFEARRQVAGFDRRSLVLLVGLLAAVGLAMTAAVREGVDPDAGLFRVEVAPGHPLAEAVDSDGRFTRVDAGQYAEAEADLLLAGEDIHFRGEKGRAAVEALQQATARWLEGEMRDEEDQAAAFPVRADVIHRPRALAAPASEPAGDNSGTTATSPPAIVQDTTGATEVQTAVLPRQIESPFPIRSLLLTFAYMVPMNLLGQTFSGALLSERTRGRGLLLLSAPVSGPAALWGKAIPYAGLTLILAAAVTLWVGAGIVGFLAALSFLAFLLCASAYLGVVARNLRELTFFQVGLTTGTSLLLFLPAIFTALPPIAFLSPVHVVAASIRGEAIGLVPFLYAVLPVGLAAIAFATLATALYQSGSLFDTRTPVQMFQAAARHATRARWQYVAAGALALPFAYALELILIVFAVALDLRLAFLVLLFAGALVEEIVKALAPLAHRRPPWVAGLLVGTGFFFAEKIALLLGLAGFADLPFGSATLATFGAGGPVLLIAPWLLHSATATISVAGIRRGGAWRTGGIYLAIITHAAYNGLLVLGAA